jgi:hypothetical protein
MQLVHFPFSMLLSAMGHNTSTEKRRTTLTRLPIRDLCAWHLVAACPECRQDRCVHIEGLVKRFGPEATLVMLLPRLRCATPGCRRPPNRVTLRNRYPAQFGQGELVESS